MSFSLHHTSYTMHHTPFSHRLISPLPSLGRCTSNGTVATCDGSYDVPFLSPKLQQLHGAEDLYQFWEQSGKAGYTSVG
ncbi:hypothetical protein EON63_19400, partial [archaeon]